MRVKRFSSPRRREGSRRMAMTSIPNRFLVDFIFPPVVSKKRSQNSDGLTSDRALRRQTPCIFSIRKNLPPFLRDDINSFSGFHHDPRMGGMGALEHFRELLKEFPFWNLFHHADVQYPIIHDGLGGDLHPSSVKRGIGDGHHHHTFSPDLIINGHLDLQGLTVL